MQVVIKLLFQASVESGVSSVKIGEPSGLPTTETVTDEGVSYAFAFVPERVQDSVAIGISGSFVPTIFYPVTTN